MSANIQVSTVRPPAVRRLAKVFTHNEDGATAVEFAFIAVPFFALIFAIFELALIFFGTQMLETATADAARLILTGQQQKKDGEAKPDGTPKTTAEKLAAFRKGVCDPNPTGDRSMLSYLFDCNNIKVDVQSYTCFTGATMSTPNTLTSFVERYDPGGPGNVVVVRVMYEWNTSVINWPIDALRALTMNFSTPGNSGKRVLMAVTAFRNEPYGVGVAATSC